MMAVHFNFIVCDEDAENIMFAMQNRVCSLLERQLDAVATGDPLTATAFKEAAAYYKELQLKMTNTQVKNEQTNN